MARDPLGEDDPPDLQTVLDALDDEDCREFVRAADEPMTARELSETCDVPLSTTYRKLDLLTEASLLAERTEVRSDGQHTSRYAPEFDSVCVSLDEDREFDVEIDRPERSPDRRLAEMWSELRKET
jgi:DNA-binding transcriptional ArsR family regulator